jgi:V/A-type H+-transporting ATPase subunit A
MDRQKYMLNKVIGICRQEFDFEDFEQIVSYFKQIINLMKQMNYAPFKDADFNKYEQELEQLLTQNDEVPA